MINTVLGPCKPQELGVTLMHEHLLIGWPGWSGDAAAPAVPRQEMLKACVDLVHEVKALGISTIVDPCPIDLGRDLEFMAEVAQATGMRVVCATGLYKEDMGAATYFKFRSPYADVAAEMAETFIKEISEGIGGTGIKPGIIKVATGAHAITDYEQSVLRGAARAAKATGVGVTTHTDEGSLGPEQLDIFASEGLDLSRVIVGHSCGSADLGYHARMLDRGAYIGFDRFGLEFLQPDRLRLAALIGLLGIGLQDRIVISHDYVCCWRGRPLPLPPEALGQWHPAHIVRHIVPALREAGVPQAKIDTLLIHNPRRFFEG